MENRYDKYKDSGIAWIGEIPEHWEKICLKRLSNINTGNQDTQDSVSDGKYPFFVRSPKVERSNKYTFEGASILMAGDGVGAGKVFHLADDKFACHQRVYCINQFKRVNRIYLFYYLSSLFYHVIESANSKSTVDSVRLPMLEEFPVFIPIGLEQQSIATYLDKKCGEIDELITLQEKMITKLQSYKQSVITEAVTKGLDKNVPLKDSGIEWIGEIPEHWNICKLKNIFLLSTGTTPKDFDKISEGDNLINWYTPSDILDSCNDLFSSQRKLSEKVIYDNKIPLFPIGTLLYVGIGASAGKVGYANENGYSNQQITGLLPLECYSRFYFYYLSALKDKIRDNAFFTTLPIINNAYLGQELIPYPPIYEQQSIADYLDQKCSEIDELISIKQQKIVKLKDYKKSLIFECVTGKRKVS